MLGFFKKSPRIQYVSLSLQGYNVRIPYAILKGDTHGKTILITAGMDGDEYAGIAAAYQFIERFTSDQYAGTIIVIPIVNIWGFEKGMSLNPIDQVYPKYTFPGKSNGTVTEQLIHWLTQTYVYTSDWWIDLHGGAMGEKIQPFLWTYQTNNKEIDKLTRNILIATDTHVAVYEKVNKGRKSAILAKENIGLTIVESGDNGSAETIDIQRHIDWVDKIIHAVQGNSTTNNKGRQVYRGVDVYRATKNGLWYGDIHGESLEKGVQFGTLKGLTGEKLQTMYSKKSGIWLWQRIALSCQKGNDVLAIAHTSEVL